MRCLILLQERAVVEYKNFDSLSTLAIVEIEPRRPRTLIFISAASLMEMNYLLATKTPSDTTGKVVPRSNKDNF